VYDHCDKQSVIVNRLCQETSRYDCRRRSFLVSVALLMPSRYVTVSDRITTTHLMYMHESDIDQKFSVFW